MELSLLSNLDLLDQALPADLSPKNSSTKSHKRSSTISANQQSNLFVKTLNPLSNKCVRDVSPLVYRDSRIANSKLNKHEINSIFINSGSSVLRPPEEVPIYFHWKSVLPALCSQGLSQSATPESFTQKPITVEKKNKKRPMVPRLKKPEIQTVENNSIMKNETSRNINVMGVATPKHNRYRHLRALSLLSELANSIEFSKGIASKPEETTRNILKPASAENALNKVTEETPRKTLLKPRKKEKKLAISTEVSIIDDKQLKESAYLSFLESLRLSNGISLPHSDLRLVKFYLGPGNNSPMISWILRTRPWMSRTETRKEATIIWTSNIHMKTIKALPQADWKYSDFVIDRKIPRLARKIETEKERLGYSKIMQAGQFLCIEPKVTISNSELKIHNHLEGNKHLCTKKGLFKNLKRYYESIDVDPFEVIPLTFHISKGIEDPQFKLFKEYFNSFESESRSKNTKNIWIIKPGEGTNRGNGIKVSSSLDNIERLLQSYSERESKHTYIVQKYIENPLLIYKRKFDIRCFGMITCINGNIQGYFYEDGYIRTSCKEYSVKKLSNRYIHLTNDAVQKKSDDYGKFEPGNKLSYVEFQEYLDEINSGINFNEKILKKIRNTITDTFKSVYKKIDPKRRLHSFELFGYDFMIDEEYNVWLIEANTNPCLELSCAYLSSLIPGLIDNVFRITLDPIFPVDTKKYPNWIADSKIHNKFELVFSEFCEN